MDEWLDELIKKRTEEGGDRGNENRCTSKESKGGRRLA